MCIDKNGTATFFQVPGGRGNSVVSSQNLRAEIPNNPRVDNAHECGRETKSEQCTKS